MSDGTVEGIFQEFWRVIVCPNGDGVLDVEQVKKELADYHDLLHEVPKVYDHITGGRISKPHTHAHAVIAEADEHYAHMSDDPRHVREAYPNVASAIASLAEHEQRVALVRLAARWNNGDAHFDHVDECGASWLCMKCARFRHSQETQ